MAPGGKVGLRVLYAEGGKQFSNGEAKQSSLVLRSGEETPVTLRMDSGEETSGLFNVAYNEGGNEIGITNTVPSARGITPDVVTEGTIQISNQNIATTNYNPATVSVDDRFQLETPDPYVTLDAAVPVGHNLTYTGVNGHRENVKVQFSQTRRSGETTVTFNNVKPSEDRIRPVSYSTESENITPRPTVNTPEKMEFQQNGSRVIINFNQKASGVDRIRYRLPEVRDLKYSPSSKNGNDPSCMITLTKEDRMDDLVRALKQTYPDQFGHVSDKALQDLISKQLGPNNATLNVLKLADACPQKAAAQ